MSLSVHSDSSSRAQPGFLLALDTSGPACSAAIVDCATGEMLASDTLALERGHAEVIVQLVERLLSGNALSFEKLQKIAVCTGPGSFAGLRVGLSAAKGFALVSGCEIVGISAFDAHAKNISDGTWIALDGRRGEVFLQRAGEPDSATRVNVTDLPDFRFSDERICGPFAADTAEAAGFPPEKALASPSVADIEHIARLGLQAEPAEHPASLNYMRGADAKPGAGFAIRRAS